MASAEFISTFEETDDVATMPPKRRGSSLISRSRRALSAVKSCIFCTPEPEAATKALSSSTGFLSSCSILL